MTRPYDPIREAIDRANVRVVARRREQAERVAANARAFADAHGAVETAKEGVCNAMVELLAVKPLDPNHLVWRRSARAVRRLEAAQAALDELHRQRILDRAGTDE